MKEIECRFLEVNKEALIKKLLKLGAKDKGEKMLEEVVLYKTGQEWKPTNGFVRIRTSGDTTTLAYKEHREHSVDGTFEIELKVEDFKKAHALLECIGWGSGRFQQKKRHTFTLHNVTIDIDTWPRVPTYVELEGESEKELKEMAKILGLDWKNVEFHNARWVIETHYKIPLGTMKYFTFNRFE
jgi:adenylate cyclase class 2